MTKELKKQLHEISQAFYDWLSKMTVENWREPIEEPIDTFCNYDDEAGAELARIYAEYEDDPKTLNEIDLYLNQVVEAVNNGVALETRGGAREGAGRKPKPETDKAVTVSFCCTPEQKESLQEAVKASGLTQSAYITNRLFCGDYQIFMKGIEYGYKKAADQIAETWERCLGEKIKASPPWPLTEA